MSKKGLSPLVATVLLVGFALVLGIITMNFGKTLALEEPAAESTITVSVASLDNELKQAQMDYILGRTNLEEYLAKEQEALGKMQ
ncbi:MAG TPA: archaellin/type IV pilin N-terminal domain-containing protein [Candidatus Nanoarchaeia archaeon]|nr:archaellin/type IV pilin N-terminal domain-containing protein [Candidatus Nanoarchaeia archaeon]